MAATQRDVAALAGVSPIVVSRVLHNRASTVRVSAATAERVRRAAQQLNYRRNVSAVAFRTQETKAIGILHGFNFTRVELAHGSRYFSHLMDGIIEAAFEHEYAVMLCPRLMGGLDQADAMGDGRFDGLIWYSASVTETSKQLVNTSPVPIVTIHSRACDFERKRPTVICDNPGAIRMALDHLVSLGHKQIAFAYEGYLNNSETQLRFAEFRRQSLARGLAGDAFDIRFRDGDVERWLSSFTHTALICHNESLAGRFVAAAIELGVNIPSDLSVVGFDSTEFCDQFRPRITCVRQPLQEIGRTAAELLIAGLQGQGPPDREVVLPCGFDVRESTAPPGLPVCRTGLSLPKVY